VDYILASNKGAMGISGLIIFLAIVLVAAVATAVIIGAGSALQQEAIFKADLVEDSVGAAFSIMHVMGTDGSDGDIEDFIILAKLQPGSDPIHFNYTILHATTSIWAQEMEYNSSGTSAVGSIQYWIEWLKTGPDYQIDYLNRGDIVKIRFHADTSINSGKQIKLKITPKNGFISIIEFTTPMSIRETKVNLYPLAI